MNSPDLLARCLSYSPQLLHGAVTTFLLSVVAVFFGFFIGVFLYTMRAGRSVLCRRLARAYVSLVRGTPVLAQLLVLYYLPSALGIDWPGVVAAAVGLSLNTAAYQCEILSVGFAAVPPGQIEAARTFNFTRRQTLWHVQIPQVITATLPALVSEMIDVVKASSVISVISVTDLMRTSQQLASASYRPLEVYTLGAGFYLVITTMLSLIARFHERRIARRM